MWLNSQNWTLKPYLYLFKSLFVLYGIHGSAHVGFNTICCFKCAFTIVHVQKPLFQLTCFFMGCSQWIKDHLYGVEKLEPMLRVCINNLWPLAYVGDTTCIAKKIPFSFLSCWCHFHPWIFALNHNWICCLWEKVLLRALRLSRKAL